MDIFKEVKASEQLLINLRRHFHENPEPSGEEHETIAYLKARLDDYGIDYVEVPFGGIVAAVGDDTRGKTVMLRADCDALPIRENPENLTGPKACVSRNDNACHACGHDGHMAMMLVAAKILKAHEDELKGKVYFVFERSEEVNAYCRHLIRYFHQNNIHFDAIYTTHLLATHDTGKISVEPGGVMSGAIAFNIDIVGRGGHGSRPDLSVSPIDCFAAFNQALQGLRIKYVTPFESLAYSIGSLHAGSQGNIIPETLNFTGTARYFMLEVGEKFREEFEHLLRATCEAYHCDYVINNLSAPGRAVLNNADLSDLTKRAVKKHLGEQYLGRTDPWMASESFSLYLALWPGVMVHLGMKNPDKGVGAEHHNERFDIDEDVLPIGAATAIAYAVEFLEEGFTPDFTPFDGTPMDLLRHHRYDHFLDDAK